MPVEQFVRYLSDQAKVSVIVEAGLDGRAISMEVTDQPVDAVLSLVARRLGASLRQQGSLFYIGEVRPEDRGVLVRRVQRLSQQELRQAIEVFGSEDGRTATYGDGLVVVGDTVEVLERVHQMLDEVEASDSPVWVVQLHVVSWSRLAAREFGIDVAPAADAGLAFAASSQAGTLGFSATLNASLDAILQFANNRTDVSIVAAPMFVLLDGESGELVEGSRIPVPRRVVSPEGTVSTEGFDYVQTGMNLAVGLREGSQEDARLSVNVNMSDVQGEVEDAPITGEQQFRTVARVASGGVYVLGAVVKERRSRERAFGWRTADDETGDVQVIQVWCQAYRIGKPITVEGRQQAVQEVLDVVRPESKQEQAEPPASQPVETVWRSRGAGPGAGGSVYSKSGRDR